MTRRRYLALVLLAVVLATGLRLGSWSEVFVGDRPLLDGTDGYYHLRRAHLVAVDWPRVIQFDHLMSVPEGARIQWPPLFDFLLGSASLALPGEPERSVELAGAFFPVVLGALQIMALAWLLARLSGRRAAVCGAMVGALLPGVVRYGLLGALDHDPMIELEALLVLAGLAGALAASRWSARRLIRHAVEIGLPLAALALTWAGAVLHIGIFAVVAGAVVWGGGASRSKAQQLGSALGLGAGGAALLVLPFVATSVWTETGGATFEGLSWLQETALVGLATIGSGLAWWSSEGPRVRRAFRILTLSGSSAILVLLPMVVVPLVEGMAFLGRSEPFLEAVAESRPLLSLFGGLDLRPLLVRLSALPLAYPILLPWLVRRSPRWPGSFVAAWAVCTLGLALLQARYSHAAALAAVAVFGLVFESVSERLRTHPMRSVGWIAVGVLLLPSVAAYTSVPGFEAHRLLGRQVPVRQTGYEAVCRFLARASPPRSWLHPDKTSEASVLAPWAAGHWIHWLARKATVACPFGPQGQPGYGDGVLFYFLEHEDRAAQLLRRRRVRWIVVDSDLLQLETAARLAGLDARRFIESDPEGGMIVNVEALRGTVGARLALRPHQPDGDVRLRLGGSGLELREVFRTQEMRRGPFGSVPWIRVYEVKP